MKNTMFFILIVSLLIFEGELNAQSSQDNLSSTSIEQESLILGRYRLYPTTNIWTFIKLDTRTGKMWQVQFDVQGSERMQYYLNLMSLSPYDSEIDGRFRLYPTQNNWTFLLLDQIDGGVWQVQWSQDASKRLVLEIE